MLLREDLILLLSGCSFGTGSFEERKRGRRPAGRVELVDAFCLGLCGPEGQGRVDNDL